ncbi:hypothetical protein [Novosphingopyxis sp.]|uniref:hypothetical protein n=1 Tax=Novosphingopyxis sp. TaxID=2709690 RepID=UPI003B59D283
MPKQKTPNRAPTVSSAPTTYPIANTAVAATQLFKVPERHPRGEGPWKDEADKIGWTDEHTGLQCIILRQQNGTLGGYVAVEVDHPLFGYAADAIPGDLHVAVHRGLSYAAICEPRKAEAVSVCHVPPSRHGSSVNDLFDHADLWWLGFDTDHDHDFVPRVEGGQDEQINHGRTYRDQGYVYRECIKLAAQLQRIETWVDAPLPGELQQTIPPIGETGQ